MATITAADAAALTEAFAAYEARQLTIAIRQGDIDPDDLGINHGGDRVDADDLPASIIVDSLEQHPDALLAGTVGRPELTAAAIHDAIVAHLAGDTTRPQADGT